MDETRAGNDVQAAVERAVAEFAGALARELTVKVIVEANDAQLDLGTFFGFWLGVELAGRGADRAQLRAALADVASGERLVPALEPGEEWKGSGRHQQWTREAAQRVLRAPGHVTRAEEKSEEQGG